MNQQQHDARSLAWHRYIVARIHKEGILLDDARRVLAHWQSLGPRPNRSYLAEWQVALNAGLDAVERLATDESEHGNALRQCSPLSVLLSYDESRAFREEWRENVLGLPPPDRAPFGVPVYTIRGKRCVSNEDLKRLPFFDFWEDSALGSAQLVCEGERWIYLNDFEAFARLFIATGKHRFSK